ncbi:hypothetical protein [Leptospira meyeri]|uniref:hypothetical protein n=1 Tax=Leptospira meyeri TaxID=29508 RepID=UPI003B8A5FE6
MFSKPIDRSDLSLWTIRIFYFSSRSCECDFFKYTACGGNRSRRWSLYFRIGLSPYLILSTRIYNGESGVWANQFFWKYQWNLQ